MKPTGHMATAVVLGGFSAIFINLQVAVGAFIGSLAPDIDHVTFFLQIERFNLKTIFSVKEFFRIFKMLYKRFLERQWLEVYFLHAIETYLLIFLAAAAYDSHMLYGLLAAMVIHCTLDYIDIQRRHKKMGLRCWSIIQYFIRKRRGEKTYFELWHE